MKLGIVFNPNKFSGKLTKFWTGCYAYHVVWVDEERGLMYDMNLLRRRRKWPHYGEAEVLLFDFPKVTQEFLEEKLSSDDSVYGWKDYLLFSLRPLYHLLGKNTRNAGGVICSEMTNNDIWECGDTTPWPVNGPPPSPCDFYNWLKLK